jgi:hypothetical protein
MRTGVNGSGDRRGADGTRTRAHSVHTALCLLAAFALATGCHPSSAQTWDKVKEDLASRGITPSLVYDGNLLTDGAGGLSETRFSRAIFICRYGSTAKKHSASRA